MTAARSSVVIAINGSDESNKNFMYFYNFLIEWPRSCAQLLYHVNFYNMPLCIPTSGGATIFLNLVYDDGCKKQYH